MVPIGARSVRGGWVETGPARRHSSIKHSELDIFYGLPYSPTAPFGWVTVGSSDFVSWWLIAVHVKEWLGCDASTRPNQESLWFGFTKCTSRAVERDRGLAGSRFAHHCLQERATAICFEKKKKRQSLQAVALISKISWKRSELLVSYRIAIV
jgi:hypothetical protein